MGHALTEIAGDDIDLFTSGIAADESAIVDRVEHLAGPAMHLLAEIRDELADPGFDRFETDIAIVGFAGFVVAAARDQIVGRAGAGIEAHVMVGVGHVPVERIGERAARNREGHRIGAIRRHLAVQVDGVVDRRIGGEHCVWRGDAGAVLGRDPNSVLQLLDFGDRAVGEISPPFSSIAATRPLRYLSG